jgi:hypothetical protein
VTGLQDAERDRRHAGAADLADRLERDRHPVALVADQVLARHVAVVEDQLPGVRAAKSHLALVPPGGESRRSLLDDERAEPARPSAVLKHHDCVEVVVG